MGCRTACIPPFIKGGGFRRQRISPESEHIFSELSPQKRLTENILYENAFAFRIDTLLKILELVYIAFPAKLLSYSQ